MKYCPITTRSHPLSVSFPQYLENINTIIETEGGTLQPFTNEVALLLDKIKDCSDKTLIKGHKSMDMVLGLNDHTHLNPFSLLVDLKLNCKGTKSLSDSDCKDKIRHSRLLLFGSGIPVYHRYVFIFSDKLFINESRSVISRRLNNPFADVLNINEFKLNYF
jgi:hypothetical protein